MKSTVNYLNPQDFDRLLAAIPSLTLKKWSHTQVQFLLKCCYWCGLRPSEGCRLKAEDFDFDRHELFLGKTKTEKGATQNIPPQFELEAKEYVKDQKGRLFPGLTRLPMYRWLKKLGVDLNLDCFTEHIDETGEDTVCHIFRKTMGKDMLYGTHGRKAPLNIIMKSLRHTTLDTTVNYLKIRQEEVKDWWRETENNNSMEYF